MYVFIFIYSVFGFRYLYQPSISTGIFASHFLATRRCILNYLPCSIYISLMRIHLIRVVPLLFLFWLLLSSNGEIHDTPAVYFFVFPTSSADIAFPTHTHMYADTKRFPHTPTPTPPPSLRLDPPSQPTTTPHHNQRQPPIPSQRTPRLTHNLALTHRATTLAHVSDPSLDLSGHRIYHVPT